LDFSATEYGRKAKVVASEETKAQIQRIGINNVLVKANLIEKTSSGN
jgi:hypothetical protein